MKAAAMPRTKTDVKLLAITNKLNVCSPTHWASSLSLWLLALFSVIAFQVSTHAQSFEMNPAYHTARGPIAIRDMRPYNLLFLQFLPESADVLPRKADQFGLQFDVANNLLIPNPNGGATVVEDNEYQRLSFSWRHGIGKEMEAALFVPLLWRNGGFLDGILSGYHSLIGFAGDSEDNPAGRDRYPSGPMPF